MHYYIWQTDQGVLQLWVSVRETAPSLWNILSTGRLVPMAWPDSTEMRLATRPDLCASSRLAESFTN